jgi:integrase/recombinase XerD
MRFTGIVRPEEFRIVTRAHVIAWRDDLERRGLKGPTRRNRLAALSSLFEYLCDKNTVSHNPVKGIKRPKSESGQGTTPTIGDHQARQLLAASVSRKKYCLLHSIPASACRITLDASSPTPGGVIER